MMAGRPHALGLSRMRLAGGERPLRHHVLRAHAGGRSAGRRARASRAGRDGRFGVRLGGGDSAPKPALFELRAGARLPPLSADEWPEPPAWAAPAGEGAAVRQCEGEHVCVLGANGSGAGCPLLQRVPHRLSAATPPRSTRRGS